MQVRIGTRWVNVLRFRVVAPGVASACRFPLLEYHPLSAVGTAYLVHPQELLYLEPVSSNGNVKTRQECLGDSRRNMGELRIATDLLDCVGVDRKIILKWTKGLGFIRQARIGLLNGVGGLLTT